MMMDDTECQLDGTEPLLETSIQSQQRKSCSQGGSTLEPNNETTVVVWDNDSSNTNILQEVVEKKSCCKSKSCQSKKEAPVELPIQQTSSQQHKSCCSGNTCAKKVQPVESLQDTPQVKKACCSGNSCSKKSNPTTSTIAELNPITTVIPEVLSVPQTKRCCKSASCSKNKTQEAIQKPLEPVPQTKSCCQSKSCSKSKQSDEIVVNNSQPQSQAKNCCQSKSCSKNQTEEVTVVAELSAPQQKSSCCSGNTCSKKNSSSITSAPVQQVETQAKSCCQSKSCSKKKEQPVEQILQQPLQAQAKSCCQSKTCSKTKKQETIVDAPSEKKSCCETKSCSKKKQETTGEFLPPVIPQKSCCSGKTCSKRAPVVEELDIELDLSDNSQTILNLSVHQLHCSECALMVEETLVKTRGVYHARVMEMTNSARVIYDKSMLNESQIILLIERLGFPAMIAADASSTSVAFYVSDELAQRDAFNLEKLVELSAGVSAAVYDFKTRVLTVEYDPEATGARSIKNLISSENIQVSIYTESKEKSVRNESKIWQRNLIICLLLSSPVIFISFIAPLITSVNNLVKTQIVQGLTIASLISWILATPIQFYFGKPLYLSAYRALRFAKKPNMDTLVMLSTTTAYVYSVISTVVAMIKKDYKAEAFFETSALLLTFIILGRYLEVLAKGQTSNILAKMTELRVSTATLLTVEDSSTSAETVEQLIKEEETYKLMEETIEIELVQRGDILKVLPGSKIPTDGVVVFGSTSIDESMISGESLPVTKAVNNPVFGSTINQHGTIYIRVTKTASENTLSAIDKLIHESQSSKVPIQRVADTVSAYFVPIIMALAVLAFILWISLVYANVLKPDVHPITFSLQFALAILVISCPCAISLAAPTAVMVGIGVGAKFGVLFKSGAVIETCHKVNAIIFDKTGTLTNGKPVVTDCFVVDEKISLKTFMGLIGSAELGSEHVLGKAIVDYAQDHGVSVEQPSNFTAEPGKGLVCNVQSSTVLAGNIEWMKDNSVCVDYSIVKQINNLESEGKTVVCVAIDGSIAGVVALADTSKEEAAEVVKELKRRGIEVWVVSGDNQITTEQIAFEVGIDNVMGGVLPANKAAKVKELQSENKTVAMVGDGINDSPSLAQADVGIAIGAGSDIALETADIILVKSDLRDVLTAVDLSRTTFRRIKLNFVWAFFYNAIGIPLAAGALYPLFKISIPPAIAGLSEIFSSLPVILFSLLLKTYKRKY